VVGVDGPCDPKAQSRWWWRVCNKKKWMCSIKPCCLCHKMSYLVQGELVGSKNEGVASIRDGQLWRFRVCFRWRFRWRFTSLIWTAEAPKKWSAPEALKHLWRCFDKVKRLHFFLHLLYQIKLEFVYKSLCLRKKDSFIHPGSAKKFSTCNAKDWAPCELFYWLVWQAWQNTGWPPTWLIRNRV
jgi:hypothetical protein